MVVKAISKRNGAVYPLSDEYYNKYQKDWELIEEPKEVSYKELKAKLEGLGVEFKKNASKKTLQELLEGEEV